MITGPINASLSTYLKPLHISPQSYRTGRKWNPNEFKPKSDCDDVKWSKGKVVVKMWNFK